MHESSHPQIKQYVDNVAIKDGKLVIEGWVASPTLALVGLSCEAGDRPLGRMSYPQPRPDVFLHYKGASPGYLNSGFRCEVPLPLPVPFPAKLSLVATDVAGVRHLVVAFEIQGQAPSTPAATGAPDFAVNAAGRFDFLVVDNFYRNADQVRAFALTTEFEAAPSYHKGQRTASVYRTDGVKAAFERLMQKRITKWDYTNNGVFQFCTAEDQLVYHMDDQLYAAVVYLSPDAPPESGTSLYRSKGTGLRAMPTEADIARLRAKDSAEALSRTFPTGFYDRSQFELVDSIGNVYNRLVIWNAKLLHAASGYFGNTKENGRLFQMFFFDAE